MAVCGRTEAEARQKLGDVLDFALNTELKAANLKKETGPPVKGLGFRVYGLGFRVYGLGFTVYGLGFTV